MHDVILLHGIRTQAFWYDVVRPTLEDIPGVRVIPLRYGYFDVVRFILPGFMRKSPQKLLAAELRALEEENKSAGRSRAISVIAHSFGTYTIGHVLRENPDIRLCNLVLCGSVLPESYNFEQVAPQISHVTLNEVGFRDPWPLIAKVLSVGYGGSGTNGFGRALCHDRHHNVDHGSFFQFGLIHRYWRPLFAAGTIVPSDFNRNAVSRPRGIRLLSVLPRTLVPWLLLACGIVLMLRQLLRLIGWL